MVDGVTTIAGPVSPVDHSTTPVQFFTSSVTLSPGQTLSVLQITSGVGPPGVTVIVTLAFGLSHLPILQ